MGRSADPSPQTGGPPAAIVRLGRGGCQRGYCTVQIALKECLKGSRSSTSTLSSMLKSMRL